MPKLRIFCCTLACFMGVGLWAQNKEEYKTLFLKPTTVISLKLAQQLEYSSLTEEQQIEFIVERTVVDEFGEALIVKGAAATGVVTHLEPCADFTEMIVTVTPEFVQAVNGQMLELNAMEQTLKAPAGNCFIAQGRRVSAYPARQFSIKVKQE